MRITAAAILGLAVLGAISLETALPAAQQAPGTPPAPPPVTFKVETAYVDVDAVVTDQQGNVVRDLTKDDFELLEDGHPQRIDMFTSVDIPLVTQNTFLGANRPISSDVKTKAPSAT